MTEEQCQRRCEISRNWRVRHPEASREASRKYRQNNYAKVYAKAQEWAKAHPERLTVYRLRQADNNARWSKEHRESKRESYRRWCAKDRSRYLGEYRKYHLKGYYGMTVEEYAAMAESQKGLCAICQKPPSGKRHLSVDHCHKSKAVRSLLYDRCNMGLGLFGEDVDILVRAIEYLIKSQGES